MLPHVYAAGSLWFCSWTGRAGTLVATGDTPAEAIESWWFHYGETEEVREQVRIYRASKVAQRIWDWMADGHPAWN